MRLIQSLWAATIAISVLTLGIAVIDGQASGAIAAAAVGVWAAYELAKTRRDDS